MTPRWNNQGNDRNFNKYWKPAQKMGFHSFSFLFLTGKGVVFLMENDKIALLYLKRDSGKSAEIILKSAGKGE